MPSASDTITSQPPPEAATGGIGPDVAKGAPLIHIEGLTIAYGSFVLMHAIECVINKGDVFVIMGGSGCGKTTLMRAMIGLKAPAKGRVLYGETSFWDADEATRTRLVQSMGVLYQQGALWSSMTLAENVALPIGEYTDLTAAEIKDLVSFKLALVGLAGFDDYYPVRDQRRHAQARRARPRHRARSGGAVLRRAVGGPRSDQLAPPRRSDPRRSRESLGATVVMVTHELPSIFAIANNSVFLDAETRTQLATGNPRDLLADTTEPKVRTFLTRGEAKPATEP